LFTVDLAFEQPAHFGRSCPSSFVDAMIAQRKKTAIPKAVSNVDRSIATSRAKRNAAVRARRGLSSTPKATQMEIEKEVEKEWNKTAIKKLKSLPKKDKKSMTKAERDESRKITRDGQKAAKQEQVILPPTRKQIKAARKAMTEAGYTFPVGTDLQVVTRKPAATSGKNQAPRGQLTPQQPPQQKMMQTKPQQSSNQQQQPKPKKNKNNSRRGGKK
jgi:hypothetical protein